MRAEIRAEEAKLSNALSAAARSGAPGNVVAAGRAALARAKPAEAQLLALTGVPGGVAKAGPAKIAAADIKLTRQLSTISASLKQLDQAYAARADRARRQAETGTVIAMLLLLAVFGYFYFRSDRLTRENQRLRWRRSSDGALGHSSIRTWSKGCAKPSVHRGAPSWTAT